jgi:hypothetical protein
MNSIPKVKKASGELEPFNKVKLEGSLRRAGANSEEVEDVVSDIMQWISEGVTTKSIYTKAFGLLRKQKRSLAARYSLKNALMELGPTGFPFEHFIGQIFKLQGFQVEVGQILQGLCVTHEVDVVATKGDTQCLVECKFHNSPGKISNVQTPMYVRSRVDDIVKKRRTIPPYSSFTFEGWLVTNTRFTSDAQDYGKCAGLNLLSWDYPLGNSLKEIIEKERLFPVSTITQLSKSEKQQLYNRGIVLCQQLVEQPDALDSFGFSAVKLQNVISEAADLCHRLT